MKPKLPVKPKDSSTVQSVDATPGQLSANDKKAQSVEQPVKATSFKKQPANA